ncbi:AAA family ATPase [Micromonospora rifamycinica]|uniref:ATP-binding protein n=1 Tax=Micromonospora rifamycinica TaxID=291594 RepID=UPI00340D1520
MPGTLEIGPRGTLARVRLLGDEGYMLYLDLGGGGTGWVRSEEPFDLSPGDVILLLPNGGGFERVPADLWHEESLVGVVRLKLADTTVINQSGIARAIPTRSEVAYEEGYTVEYTTTTGVVRVLAREPLQNLDLEDVTESQVRQFIKDADYSLDFDDFGGLEEVVTRARELIETPLKFRDALAHIRARPIKGVLFTGAPGTGKTMLARIIASKADATFYQISGPEIVSKWYGQSEQLLRKIFEHASQQERAIIFFDEIDSVATQRSEDAHEASRRIVAQLLTLMDGFDRVSNVVVIATTNRPQDIDSALRRPGRFDWEIEFPLPVRMDREAMLRASARNLRTAGSLPYALIAEKTDSWSAAELAAIWSEAALLAVTDGRSAIIAEDLIGGFERTLKHKRYEIKRPKDGAGQ